MLIYSKMNYNLSVPELKQLVKQCDILSFVSVFMPL